MFRVQQIDLQGDKRKIRADKISDKLCVRMRVRVCVSYVVNQKNPLIEMCAYK